VAKSLEFHPAAATEAEQATTWYLERSPHAAQRFVEELAQALDLITQAPDRWPRGPEDTRRILLRRFPFAVVYREEQSVIQVVAVAHGRRKPGYWRDRH